LQTLNIFKAGTHTSNEGAVIDFAEELLVRSAAAYDPEIHEAPIVIGHPRTDDPAYGWIKGLAYNEQTGMEAEPHQVNPDFADMVNGGAFKKISASFYTPDSPVNPVPGVYYLRHVGFLGAQPPAIKGMRAPSFSEQDEGVVAFDELEFSSPYTTGTIGSLFRRLREWIISRDGVAEADMVIPDYHLQDIEDEARRELNTPAAPSPAFSEHPDRSTDMPMTEEELKAAQARLEADQAAFAEQQTALKSEQEAIEAEKKRQRREANVAFAEKLIQEGKIKPTDKESLVAFMETMTTEAAVSFGEGGSATQTNPMGWFKSFLESREPVVDFNEASTEDGHASDQEWDADTLQKQAVAYKERLEKEGTTINIAQAVNAVLAGKHKA